MADDSQNRSKKTLELMLHYKCNNGCIFCPKSTDKKEIPINRAKKLITDYASKDYKNISFNGGEPTIYRGLSNLIKFAKKVGYKKIQVKSNGLMLSYNNYAKKLIESGVNYFSISVWAFTRKNTNSLCRNNNCYQLQRKAFKNLRQFNVSVEVEVLINRLCQNNLLQIVKSYTANSQYTFNFWLITTNSKNQKLLFPDIDVVKENLIKTLEYCKNSEISARVLHIPKCLLPPNLRSYVQLEKNEDVLIIDPGGIFHISKQNFFKDIKTNKCKECIYDNECYGFRKHYLSEFGENILSPCLM